MHGAIPAAARAPIERASSTDLSMRALAARGSVPQQLGAVLLLDSGRPDRLADVERALVERLGAVPRLRQCLVRLPPGFGRPIWLDDPAFEAAGHVRPLRCPAPGDEQALLDLATSLVCEPLPQDRPLWSAALVTGLTGGRAGLVVVLDHVLVDGIGGVAVLGQLVDPPAGRGAGAAKTPDGRSIAGPRPPYRRLAADSIRSKVRAVAALRATWRGLRTVTAAGGGVRPPRAVPCSLVRPTGTRRRMAVVRGDPGALHAAAHRHDGTVNDALLAAVSGALATLLVRRGESPPEIFVVTVMVTARRTADVTELGNAAAPLLLPVPVSGDAEARLRGVAGRVRSARAGAATRPMIAVLGPLFRVLAALGVYRWWLGHQRRFHTILSHVRGPDRPLTLAGIRVSDVLPIAVGEAGNVSVQFLALSCAGALTVTLVADPDAVPDLEVLASALQRELDALAGTSVGAAGMGLQ